MTLNGTPYRRLSQAAPVVAINTLVNRFSPRYTHPRAAEEALSLGRVHPLSFSPPPVMADHGGQGDFIARRLEPSLGVEVL